MRHVIIIVTIALSAISCNKTLYYDEVDPETLKPSGSGTTSPSYSFESELNDEKSRYVSETLTLRYDDGGVLFSRELGNGTTTYRAVELTTGNSVELQMPAGRLLVNDAEVATKSATVERKNGKGAWIHIQTPDYKHIVFVVTDL